MNSWVVCELRNLMGKWGSKREWNGPGRSLGIMLSTTVEEWGWNEWADYSSPISWGGEHPEWRPQPIVSCTVGDGKTWEGQKLWQEGRTYRKGPPFKDPNGVSRDYWLFSLLRHWIIHFQTHIYISVAKEANSVHIKILNWKVSKYQPHPPIKQKCWHF